MEKVQVSIMATKDDAYEMDASANETIKAFFKMYTKLSPKMKQIKSKDAMALVEDIVSSMKKLSNMIGKRADGKKGGFANLTHAPKRERMAANAELTAGKYTKANKTVLYTEIRPLKEVFKEAIDEDDGAEWIDDVKSALGSGWAKYYSNAYGTDAWFRPEMLKAVGKKPVFNDAAGHVYEGELEAYSCKGKLYVRAEEFDALD